MNDTTSAPSNLLTHRASASVWDRSGWDGSNRRALATRALITAGGATLAVQGMRLRSWPGTLLAATGGALAWWGLSGRPEMTDFSRRVGEIVRWRLAPTRQDPVHEASDESFPASDAPAWTPTVGSGLGRPRRSV